MAAPTKKYLNACLTEAHTTLTLCLVVAAPVGRRRMGMTGPSALKMNKMFHHHEPARSLRDMHDDRRRCTGTFRSTALSGQGTND
jgi:hypothetical protein